MPGDIKGTFTEGWDEGLENIKEGSEEWFDAIKTKVGWGKKKAKKALEQKKHIAAIELKEKQKEERKIKKKREIEQAQVEHLIYKASAGIRED